MTRFPCSMAAMVLCAASGCTGTPADAVAAFARDFALEALAAYLF